MDIHGVDSLPHSPGTPPYRLAWVVMAPKSRPLNAPYWTAHWMKNAVYC